MELTANPDAVITLTVNNYKSVTQGMMLTTGTSPDVTADLLPGGSSRVTKKSNNLFEVSQGSSVGNHLDLQIEVRPAGTYDAVGLIIRDPSNGNAGSDYWDDCRVGNGSSAHVVTVRDKGKVDPGSSITYELYMLIKTKVPDGPLSDYGLIDPKITNL